jgi:hypothetical protein
MFSFIFGKKCAMCKKKIKESRLYFDDAGKKNHICLMCVPYAERRAFRKVK